MRTWKMVDLEHANSVASGSLRIGTLAGYADLENGRADQSDGAIIITSPEIKFEIDGDNEINKRRINRLNIDVENSSVNFSGNIFTETSPPQWVFCMSEQGCDFDWTPNIPKAIFEISDVYAFARAVGQYALRDRATGLWGVKRMAYRPVNIDVDDAFSRKASPFEKAEVFAREREVRIVWQPLGGQAIASFNTDPNEQIAQFLTRVA